MGEQVMYLFNTVVHTNQRRIATDALVLDYRISIQELPIIQVVVEKNMLIACLGDDCAPESRDFVRLDFDVKYYSEVTDFFQTII